VSVDLSGLTNLTWVDISDCDRINSVSSSLTSVNLTGCTGLIELRLDDSDFSEGIPNLTGLSSLEWIDMDQCGLVGSINLSFLASLRGFDLSGNSSMTEVIISSTQALCDGQEINLFGCGLTQQSVDNILVALSTNGVSGGYISLHGGTNASPSATGLAAKGVGATSFAKNAGKNMEKAVKPIKTVARDVSTFVAAKRFGMQTKNVASLDVPWKELDSQFAKLADKIPGMKLGKGISLDIKAATDPDDIADMFSFNEGEVPDEMWAGLKGSFVNNNARLFKDKNVGSFTGVLMKEDAPTSTAANNFKRDSWFSMQDIYIELEKQYRGKGIAQRATTQMMELLKNAGVRNVKMNAGLSDGGYAWARAGFKFDSRPKGLIARMERIQGIVNDKQFSQLLDRLKTAEFKAAK
jgi:hypothetical protein